MKSAIFGIFAFSFLLFASCTAQEQIAVIEPGKPSPDHSGMWMLHQLRGDLYDHLNDQGLRISKEQVYSTDGPSIHHAIARINISGTGGGTGSFVSNSGLILTNHHVAYDAISSGGSDEENFLENGFYAEEMEDEIPIPEYTIYIPIEQKDITDRFQSRMDENLSYPDKLQQIEEVKQQLIDEYTGGNPDKAAEIHQVWSGNRYVLSTYQIIRDVRLVYAPEESIGKFGGDTDNWMWPRHTGDFTFLRAYVNKNGSAEPYQPQNRPYRPNHILPVRNSDLNPGDFTMTLGFPGTTYRHESSYAFDFYETRQFPVLEKAFQAYLNGLEIAASADEQYAKRNAAERASIANSLKYYHGIRSGFAEHNITEKKRMFDEQFRQWVIADSLRELKYGRVLPQLKQSYSIANQTGDVLYLSFYALQFSKILQAVMLFDDFHEESAAGNQQNYTEEEKLMLYDSLRRFRQSVVPKAEQRILKDLLFAMAELPEDRRPLVFHRFFDTEEADSLQNQLELFLNRQFGSSVLTDTSAAAKWIFSETPAMKPVEPDSLFHIAKDVHEMFEQSRENYVRHFRYLLPAQQRYVEGILEMSKNPVRYADANFTLRLSAGEIMGYKPSDGIYHLPFTTFSGMLKKHRGQAPFKLPEKLLSYRSNSHGFSPGHHSGGRREDGGKLPLNFLSTNDITGGNSGSPVLNGHGELIGLVFDGNIEGIISDYYFVPDLTRALSVDIRFILFMMDEIDNTERLLNELEIQRN